MQVPWPPRHYPTVKCVSQQYSYFHADYPGLLEITLQIYCVLLQYSYCPTGSLCLPGTVLEFVLLQYSYCPACAFGLQGTAIDLLSCMCPLPPWYFPTVCSCSIATTMKVFLAYLKLRVIYIVSSCSNPAVLQMLLALMALP